jgi:hypothetical protein
MKKRHWTQAEHRRMKEKDWDILHGKLTKVPDHNKPKMVSIGLAKIGLKDVPSRIMPTDNMTKAIRKSRITLAKIGKEK